MHSEDHLDDDLLIRLLRDPGELQEKGRQQHLDSCPACRRRFEMYQDVQVFIRGESEFEVPRGWLERMIRLFDIEASQKVPPPSENFAWLAFDSLVASAEGIRSAAALQRHLIWESPDFRVDLMIESSDGHVIQLVGQLVNKHRVQTELDGTVVEAKVGGDTFIGELNSIGEFILPVERASRGDPMEVGFRLPDRPVLTLLIPC